MGSPKLDQMFGKMFRFIQCFKMQMWLHLFIYTCRIIIMLWCQTQRVKRSFLIVFFLWFSFSFFLINSNSLNQAHLGAFFFPALALFLLLQMQQSPPPTFATLSRTEHIYSWGSHPTALGSQPAPALDVFLSHKCDPAVLINSYLLLIKPAYVYSYGYNGHSK